MIRPSFKPIIIVLFIILINFYNCSNTVETKKKEVIEFPSMQQINYKHFIFKNNKKYLYIKIEKAEFYEKQKKISCVLLDGVIYNSKGEITHKIFSNKAVIDQKDKKITFSDHVRFELIENKTTLYGDEIILDYEKNQLMSSKEVLFKKEDGSYIKATSMESDIKLESTKFENMEIKYFYEDDKEGKNKDNGSNKK